MVLVSNYIQELQALLWLGLDPNVDRFSPGFGLSILMTRNFAWICLSCQFSPPSVSTIQNEWHSKST